VQGFADLFCLGVICEEADRTIAVREEIDRVADPHGVMIVRVLARDLDDAGVFEIGDPDGSGLPAVVSLPRFLPLGMGNVGDVGPIRRKAGIFGSRKWQSGWRSAFDWNRIELILEGCEARSPGDEKNILAVGIQARDKLFGGM